MAAFKILHKFYMHSDVLPILVNFLGKNSNTYTIYIIKNCKFFSVRLEKKDIEMFVGTSVLFLRSVIL